MIVRTKQRKRSSLAIHLVHGVQGPAFERLDLVDEILFLRTDRDILACISVRVAHRDFNTRIRGNRSPYALLKPVTCACPPLGAGSPPRKKNLDAILLCKKLGGWFWNAVVTFNGRQTVLWTAVNNGGQTQVNNPDFSTSSQSRNFQA